MKRLEKLMILDEMREYLETHPKYELVENDDSPFALPMRVLKNHFIVKGKSYSKLVKFPVYVAHSPKYIEDTKEMLHNAFEHGDDKLTKYLETYNKIKL